MSVKQKIFYAPSEIFWWLPEQSSREARFFYFCLKLPGGG
jgi:hypothetical protein